MPPAQRPQVLRCRRSAWPRDGVVQVAMGGGLMAPREPAAWLPGSYESGKCRVWDVVGATRGRDGAGGIRDPGLPPPIGGQFSCHRSRHRPHPGDLRGVLGQAQECREGHDHLHLGCCAGGPRVRWSRGAGVDGSGAGGVPATEQDVDQHVGAHLVTGAGVRLARGRGGGRQAGGDRAQPPVDAVGVRRVQVGDQRGHSVRTRLQAHAARSMRAFSRLALGQRAHAHAGGPGETVDLGGVPRASAGGKAPVDPVADLDDDPLGVLIRQVGDVLGDEPCRP